MATYGGWTEVREYRVWASEDIYACVTVERHRNGWFRVYEDGSDDVYRTRSESWAYSHAKSRMEALTQEACDTCPCAKWDPEDREECEDAARNVYGDSHGVRSYVYDSVNGTELESWNL